MKAKITLQVMHTTLPMIKEVASLSWLQRLIAQLAGGKTIGPKCKGVGLQRFKSTNVWRRPCPRALPKISTSVGRVLMSALHK